MKDLEPPYGEILDLFKIGQIIPFVGAGASLSTRTGSTTWSEDKPTCLPSAAELGRHLADKIEFPDGESTDDLAKVAQYYRVVAGRLRLRQRLRSIFAREFRYASIHEFLADIPACPLIVTTNYDDLIERAFQAKKRPYDLVIHPTDNPDWAGSVAYWKHGAVEPDMVAPNKLSIDIANSTVIYKMHGAVDQSNAERDSYVISEDDYVEFLARMAMQTAIPAIFAEFFKKQYFLFLGYSLRDWNFRVILSQIERSLPRSQSDDFVSWAIQLQPSALEKALWEKRGVNIYDMSLNEFVERLRQEQAPRS